MVGIEFVPFKISFYQDYSNYISSSSSSSNSWNANGDLVGKNVANLEQSELSKIVFYGFDDANGNFDKPLKNNQNQIEVFVNNDFNISLARYIPLIKPINFSSEISYSWNHRINKNNIITTIEGSGSIDVSGNKNIYGICTGKEAKTLIELQIMNDVKKNSNISN